MTQLRVVGLDLSLTSSGLAFLSVDAEGDGDIRSKKHSSATAGNDVLQRSNRLGGLADKIIADTLDHKPHVVLVEGPSYGNTSGQHHDRSGLWWLVVNILLNDGMPVMEIPPNVLKKYATGKGNAKKLDVVIAVTRRYAYASFTTDDEADAIVLAAIGARLHGYPIDMGLPKPNLDALKTLTPMEGINA